jgi:hypothetical protein
MSFLDKIVDFICPPPDYIVRLKEEAERLDERARRPDTSRQKQDASDIWDHELGEWVPRERY